MRIHIERTLANATPELKAAYINAKEALKPARERLLNHYHAHDLPFMHEPKRTDDLLAMELKVAKLRKLPFVVVLGTGGSSLGGQALCQFEGGYATLASSLKTDTPQLFFVDNLDAESLETLLARLPLKKTAFIAISKSGGTGETLAQVLRVMGAYQSAGLQKHISEHLLGLSEPIKDGGKNALRALLEPFGVPFFEHNPRIGGRYTVLTNVGLLPAMLLGADVMGLREGAQLAVDDLIKREDEDSLWLPSAALSMAAANAGLNVHVMLAYADRLERTTRWWAQLWGESLGKQGWGSTPVPAVGPVDQHSQLQLWLDGPRDKLVTVLHTPRWKEGIPMQATWAKMAGEEIFAERTIGDLTTAQARATIDTLHKRAVPVREIELASISAISMGHFLMHMMLETILTGFACGLDPFDQPAVEEGKVLAKRYLAESHS